MLTNYTMEFFLDFYSSYLLIELAIILKIENLGQ